MEWIILRDIIRDYGNLGIIALILLLWQWTRHQIEKINIRLDEFNKRFDRQEQEFNARMDGQEQGFNARMDRQEQGFNARMDRQEQEFNARMDRQEQNFNRRFERLERLFLLHAKGDLEFNRALLTTLMREDFIKSLSAYENLKTMTETSYDYFETVIKTFENPLTERDKRKLREYIDKILKEDKFTFTYEEALDFYKLSKKVEDEYLFTHIGAWHLAIISTMVLAMAERPKKES